MHSQKYKTRNRAKTDQVRSSRTSMPNYLHPVLQLQEKFGNQAVERLFQSRDIQTKPKAGKTSEVTSVISSGIQSLQGGGQSLPGSERNFFEPRFGADFSKVRIHNDTQAGRLARSVNARAFTHGYNVVFGAGEYFPGTLSGRKLIAHELAHVIQQNGAGFVNRKISLPPLHQKLLQCKGKKKRKKYNWRWIKTRKIFDWPRLDDCLTLATPYRRRRCLLLEGKTLSASDVNKVNKRKWYSFNKCLNKSPLNKRKDCLKLGGFVWPVLGFAMLETHRLIPWRKNIFPFAWRGKQHKLVRFIWLGKVVSAHPALKKRLQSVEKKIRGFGYSPRRVSSYRHPRQAYHSLGLAIDLNPTINIDIKPNNFVHKLILKAINKWGGGKKINIFGKKNVYTGWKDLNEANKYFKQHLNYISHRSPRKWRTIVRKLAKNITEQDLKRHGFMNLSWNVVKTLTDPYPQGAGLDWGGSDFNGTRRDIMHFDFGNRAHLKKLRATKGSPVPYKNVHYYLRKVYK